MQAHILAFTALLLAAVPASADQPSAQRNSNAQMMEELGVDILKGSRLDRAIAKAEEHPLGSKENPVRADGPPGQRAYIARLRCSDGSPPIVGMRVNVGEGPYQTIVDLYPLRCGEEGPDIPLHMDMYFQHVEERAPPGFTIQSLQPIV